MSFLKQLPLTLIKIKIAKILYFIVTLFTGSKARIIERNGIKYEVDLQEGLDLSLFIFGNFQKHVSENRFITLPEDSIIIDIGANFGLMSLNYARACPYGKIFAFEPTHYALEKFKKNLAHNPELAARIFVVNTFISSEVNAAPAITAYSSWKVDGSKDADKHGTHGGTAKSTDGVGSTTLDSFCKKHCIDRVDFIKVDTDGHELEILKGAKGTIERFKPIIIFEIGTYVMDERGISFTDYIKFFDDIGFRIFESNSGREIFTTNFSKCIPVKGTIDILAVPKEKVGSTHLTG